MSEEDLEESMEETEELETLQEQPMDLETAMQLAAEETLREFEEQEDLEMDENLEGDLKKNSVEEVQSRRSAETAATERSLSPGSMDIPEGAVLQRINLDTDPDQDDYAKHLVRVGRLSVNDVVEVIDEYGTLIGTQVLSHALSRYEKEVALDEKAKSRRESTTLSSPDLLGFLDELSSDPVEGAEEDVQVEEEGDPLKYPTSIESIYKLIEPDREADFKNQIGQLQKEITSIQREACIEHKQRQILKKRKFQFEKKVILNAISESGILYLPGNFLFPIIGRRIRDSDLPLIIETIEELPDHDFKGFNFAYNDITDKGIMIIAKTVQDRHGIIHLNLSHNNFTAAGVYSLVQGLINRPSVHSLKITGAKVGDEGIDSIACLYMCGKGPRDLDVSETDMTMPGFQALCTAFQAVDEDDDYPAFLTKHKLPFSLETLARLKVENHEYLKAQTYTQLCHSHFELLGPKSKASDETPGVTESGASEPRASPNQEANAPILESEVTEWLRDCFDTSLTNPEEAKAEKYDIYLSEEATKAIQIEYESAELEPTVEKLIDDVKILKKSGCGSNRSDGKPVIVCPSLYSLDVDDKEDCGSAHKHGNTEQIPLHVNPLYMDALVDNTIMNGADSQEDVNDSHTAEKATVQFIKETFKEAGSIAGRTEYMPDSDMTQLLLSTILDNSKRFLELDSEVVDKGSNELTQAELRLVWEHSLKTTAKILRPAVPPHCTVTEKTMDVFVEEFLKVSTGVFHKLIQVPFFQDMFEHAANKGCVENSIARKREALENHDPPSVESLGIGTIVNDIVIKFLQEVIVRSGEMVGEGDPCNLRREFGGHTNNDYMPDYTWPSIVDLTEDMVEPLVEKLFEAGSLLAEDALNFQKKDEMNQDDGIEPAKLYLEGVFKQLAKFLYQVKDDDEKLKERVDKAAKKFTFSTKPVRLVLNRPFFPQYEDIMASKLGSYLRNNESVQCLHLRKWNIREDGMINLMGDLSHNMNIVTLDLSYNGIGAEGCRPLGEYIKRNKNLKHLLMGHNRLRNPGLQLLTNAIPESNLVSVNVAYNDVTEVGLNPFLEAIGKSQIYSLYILGNCFNLEGCNMLRDLLESNILHAEDCDVVIQEVDGEPVLVRNSQARDTNEWYEVPANIDVGLICPPYYAELYKPSNVSMFGATAVD